MPTIFNKDYSTFMTIALDTLADTQKGSELDA